MIITKYLGNPSDVGGNNINMTLSNTWQTSTKSTNLHSCWDTSILQHWMNIEGIRGDNIKAALKFFGYIEIDQNFKNEYLYKTFDPVGITEDTRVISLSKVYEPLANYNLASVPITYFTNSWPTVKTQIMKSGLQMAALLNDIFDRPVQ